MGECGGVVSPEREEIWAAKALRLARRNDHWRQELRRPPRYMAELSDRGRDERNPESNRISNELRTPPRAERSWYEPMLANDVLDELCESDDAVELLLVIDRSRRALRNGPSSRTCTMCCSGSAAGSSGSSRCMGSMLRHLA